MNKLLSITLLLAISLNTFAQDKKAKKNNKIIHLKEQKQPLSNKRIILGNSVYIIQLKYFI